MYLHSIYHQKRFAEEYDHDRYGGAFGQYLYAHEVETFRSMIDDYQGKLLDVGAGTGKLALEFINQFEQVIYVDFSSEMLSVASTKSKKEGVILDLIICDAHHLCFREDAVNYLVCSRVLMHLDDWRSVLSEFCRVAECVVVDFPPLFSFGGFHALFNKCKSLLVSDTRTYRTFLINSIIQELKRHNLQVVMLKRDFFLPIAFHRWLNRPRFSLILEKLLGVLGLVAILGAPVTLKAIKVCEEQL